MKQGIADKIKQASESASLETAEFLIGLDTNKILGKAFQQNSILEDDQATFISEITNVALGLETKEDLADNILVQTGGKEENIISAIDEIQDLVNQIPTSAVSAKTVLLQQTQESTDPADILSAIENPTPTVPTPAFVLPNTKPKTADVLKGLSASSIASGSIPATMPTSFPPELDLNLDTAGIVDPIKATPDTSALAAHKSDTQTTTYTNPTQVSSPQPGIGTQMDSKLTSVTGTTTKESFKVMPLSETMKSLAENQNAKAPGTATIGVQRTDPYREPIE